MEQEQPITHDELKKMLENASLKTELKLSGELALIKTPEQQEADKQIEDWKAQKIILAPVPEFAIPHELIDVLLATQRYNGLIFYGEGGIGKTVLTINSIRNLLKTEEWEYSNGYTTPLALYEFLYENRKRKVIILDDVEGIFNNNLSLTILKGALWDSDGKRIVQYSSKSDKADKPPKFIMEAKIIILCNHIPKENDISTRALLSRTIPYEIGFSFDQKMEICKRFVGEDTKLNQEQKPRVLDILQRNVSEATKDFNFRTLQKLMAFVESGNGKAEELFKATTLIDELKDAYMRAVQQTNVVKAQISIFIDLTGTSRRTFFRTKRAVSSAIVPSKSLMALD